jgi:hypothetical protein
MKYILLMWGTRQALRRTTPGRSRISRRKWQFSTASTRISPSPELSLRMIVNRKWRRVLQCQHDNRSMGTRSSGNRSSRSNAGSQTR